MKINRNPDIIGIEEYRHYAVTLPLVYKDGQWQIVFEVRSEKLRRQPGEICFPGGSVEPGEDYGAAALRECCEELMLEAKQVEMIEPLDLFLSPFGLVVHPYLAILHDYKMTFGEDEVGDVFAMPVEWLQTYEPKVYHNQLIHVPAGDFPYQLIPGGEDYRWGQGHYDVYFYEYDNRVIWGLTARILQASLGEISQYLDM